MEYSLGKEAKMTKTILDKMATQMVGDGKKPNFYFVTVRGVTMAVCKQVADAMDIVRSYPGNAIIEDRITGQYWPR